MTRAQLLGAVQAELRAVQAYTALCDDFCIPEEFWPIIAEHARVAHDFSRQLQDRFGVRVHGHPVSDGDKRPDEIPAR